MILARCSRGISAFSTSTNPSLRFSPNRLFFTEEVKLVDSRNGEGVVSTLMPFLGFKSAGRAARGSWNAAGLYSGGGSVAIAVVFSSLVGLVKETTTGNGVDERAENRMETEIW